MKNLIANVTVNGVENQVELQPIIIKKANVINLIYNCITFKDFQQILTISNTRLFKDLSVENSSQIDAEYISICAINGNGDIYKLHYSSCYKLDDNEYLKVCMDKHTIEYIMASYGM